MPEKEFVCSKEEQIDKLTKILVGNGDMKHSVLFKVNKSQLDIEDIKKAIGEIKDSQTNIMDGVVHLKESFLTFKSELEGQEKGRKEEECKNDKTFSNRMKPIGAVIAFLGVLIAMLVGFNDIKKETNSIREYVDLSRGIYNTRGGGDSASVVDSLSIYND